MQVWSGLHEAAGGAPAPASDDRRQPWRGPGVPLGEDPSGREAAESSAGGGCGLPWPTQPRAGSAPAAVDEQLAAAHAAVVQDVRTVLESMDLQPGVGRGSARLGFSWGGLDPGVQRVRT